jgi:hypothetical protein
MGCPLRSLESSRVSSALTSLARSRDSLTVTRLSKPLRRTLRRQAPPRPQVARTAAQHQFHYVILALRLSNRCLSVSLLRYRVASRHPRIVPRKVILPNVRKAHPRHRVTCLPRAVKLFPTWAPREVRLRHNRLSKVIGGCSAWFLWALFIRHFPR